MIRDGHVERREERIGESSKERRVARVCLEES